MQLDGIHHFAFNVQNMDRAEKFYTDVLGFKVSRRYPGALRHTELDAGNVVLALFEVPDLDQSEALNRLSGEGFLHFAFQTPRERFCTVVEELKGKGVVIDHGPIVLGSGESVYFKDPDGNPLEIRCPAEISEED